MSKDLNPVSLNSTSTTINDNYMSPNVALNERADDIMKTP
jgi:hypothetical protein